MIEQFASVVQRSSNPHPHQKKGVRKLSELFIQSLLGRQNQTSERQYSILTCTSAAQ
jgi:hypothetical protein